MKTYHNIAICASTLFLGATLSQAAVVYFQDFSSSNPTSSIVANNPIADDTQIEAVTGEVLTGGSSGSQSTNGDYTITYSSVSGASGGGQHNGYIFNPAGDPGFYSDDSLFVLETGTIAVGGLSGTIALDHRTNAGNEYFSINSIQLSEDDVTGEIALNIDYNYFADFANTTDSLRLTTTFGTANDVNTLFIDDLLGNTTDNFTGTGQYQLILVEGVPEPSSTALLGLGGLALILRRRR